MLAVLPSPMLGASVWRPVAHTLVERGWNAHIAASEAVLPRTAQDVLDGFLATLPPDEDLVLVPHSNAGAYVPALAAERRVIGCVFVDALLPPADGRIPLAPPALLDAMRELADDEGMLPPWTRWFDDADVAELFPDEDTRDQVELEQQSFPISYFEEYLPVPSGWDARPCAYLAFGETYASQRDEAARRGWPVRTLQGLHLHTLIDPESVAAQVHELATGLR